MKLNNLFEASAISKINLDRLYDEYNRKYFDGILPDIDIRWNNATRVGGQVTGMRRRDTGRVYVKSLVMSKHLDIDLDLFRGLFMHEMLHVFVMEVMQVAYTAGSDKHHGREFRDALKKMQVRFPYKIPETEFNSELFGVADHIKVKPAVIIVKYKKTGKPVIGALFANTYEKNKADIHQALHTMMERGDSFDLFVSDSNIISKIPKVRVFKNQYSLKFYQLPEDQINQIKDKMIGNMISI